MNRVLGVEMRTRPLAVVLGDLDLVSALGMAGIGCVSVAGQHEPVHHSRFVVGSIRRGCENEGPALVDELVSLAQAQPSRPVLFYQTDADLLLVSRNRERLREVYRFILPDAGLVESLVDKGLFHVLAVERGLPVPAARVLDSDASPGSVEDLGFPLLLKPLTRDGLQRLDQDAKAVEVSSTEELRSAWTRARRAGTDLLAQRVVDGPESAVESYHAYVPEAATVRAEFTGAKIRTRPSTFGYSTALRTTSAPDLVRQGRRLVEALDFTGVLKADFKRDGAGRLHLLEVNPRFSLWNHLGAAAGVNIPALVHADLCGVPTGATRPARTGRTWCQLGGDRRAAAELGVRMPSWVWWSLRTAARAEGRWTDPMPLLRGVVGAKRVRS